MKTFLIVIVVVAALMTPVMMLIRHFAQDENQKLQRALRDEYEAWDRMKRVMESDMRHMREYGLNGRDDRQDQ